MRKQRFIEDAAMKAGYSRVPPSPDLLRKIRNTKKMMSEARGYRFAPADVLDLKDYEALMRRSPKLRVHDMAMAASRVAEKKAKKAKVTGTRKAIVLLVDFSDKAAAADPGHFKDMLFSKATYQTGSLRDYYREASWNQLDIEGDVCGNGPRNGWFRAPETLAYYANDQNGVGDTYPKNAQKLVEDAVEMAKPFVDFSLYDVDGDGVVDALFVAHAGKGAEETGKRGDIWSHQSTTTHPIKVNGVEVSTYSIEPENGNVGVYCHELGHVFGLPDLYDYDYDSNGVGQWCIMSGGSWNNGGLTPGHMGAWCKLHMGWATSVNVKKGGVYDIPQVETNKKKSIFKLWTNGKAGEEYFLVENRQQVGFDKCLPHNGMLVWHVDEGQKNNDDQTHYLVALEQADGENSLENGMNYGDAGDPFPGSMDKRAYDDSTKPSSTSYSGDVTKVGISGISDTGKVMKAMLKVK